jgi:3-deoxy-D-arabino-heptulosonate 7-phosphate (DAHP) synthase
MSAHKLVSRTSTVTRQRTAITLHNNVTIGGTEVAIIAGPCAVEIREMIDFAAFTNLITRGAQVAAAVGRSVLAPNSNWPSPAVA